MSGLELNPKGDGGPVCNPWVSCQFLPKHNPQCNDLERFFEELASYGPMLKSRRRFLGTVLIRKKGPNGRPVRLCLEPETGHRVYGPIKGAVAVRRLPRAVYFRRWER
jgi:hypothetical protein